MTITTRQLRAIAESVEREPVTDANVGAPRPDWTSRRRRNGLLLTLRARIYLAKPVYTDGRTVRHCSKRWAPGERPLAGGGQMAGLSPTSQRCLRARSGPADRWSRGRGHGFLLLQEKIKRSRALAGTPLDRAAARAAAS